MTSLASLRRPFFLRTASTLALALLGCLAAACGGDAPADAPVWSATPATDCGDVTYGGDGACPSDLAQKLDCFVAAKTACQSARLGIQWTSEEGAPTYQELRVDVGDACRVASRSDNSKDSWAADPGVSYAACDTVARAPTATCEVLRTDACR